MLWNKLWEKRNFSVCKILFSRKKISLHFYVMLLWHNSIQRAKTEQKKKFLCSLSCCCCCWYYLSILKMSLSRSTPPPNVELPRLNLISILFRTEYLLAVQKCTGGKRKNGKLIFNIHRKWEFCAGFFFYFAGISFLHVI